MFKGFWGVLKRFPKVCEGVQSSMGIRFAHQQGSTKRCKGRQIHKSSGYEGGLFFSAEKLFPLMRISKQRALEENPSGHANGLTASEGTGEVTPSKQRRVPHARKGQRTGHGTVWRGFQNCVGNLGQILDSVCKCWQISHVVGNVWKVVCKFSKVS